MSERQGANGKQELKITFDTVRDKNIEQLRVLNNVLFPIRYQDSYYRDCLASEEMSQFACFNSISIGAIGCRLEKQEDGKAKLYIMTLGVLAPYRGMGVGSRLLRRVLKSCSHNEDVTEAYLHVHVDNKDAIQFYKKFDFEVVETIPDYYTKLTPSGAVLLSKNLREG